MTTSDHYNLTVNSYSVKVSMLSFMLPHVLELVLIKHSNKEIGPSSHSVSYKVKLLWLYTCPLQGLRIYTCNRNKV